MGEEACKHSWGLTRRVLLGQELAVLWVEDEQHGATAPGKSAGRGASSGVWSLRAACAAGERWVD